MILVMTEKETLEKKRKRLIFRSWHRGMREMDLIMGSFADEHVPEFTVDELDLYDALLKENDPDVYSWVTGKESPPANFKSNILDKLRNHKFVKSS